MTRYCVLRLSGDLAGGNEEGFLRRASGCLLSFFDSRDTRLMVVKEESP